MTVKERLIITRIVKSIRRKPEYAEQIGINNTENLYLKEEGKDNE